MAPYAIGHMKISLLLESLGYQMRDDERFNLYLTNALEMEEIQQIAIPGVSCLSEESRLAGQVKKDQSILVIMGNPPYSGSSKNSNDWTEKLLKEDINGAQSYYKVDGKPLGERNPKWIQDDYVKFLRFAQWKIQRAGKGVVAMITNHAYLDNPTFRGMRQSLMKTFDEIYVLNLHGNSMKKETAPDGSKDDNVFDIRVGAAITFFVKNHGAASGDSGRFFHADLFGTRSMKYSHLKTNQIEGEEWCPMKPSSDLYLFMPLDNLRQGTYNKFIRITEVFDLFGIGVATHRDKFVVDENKQRLLARIKHFQDTSFSDEFLRTTYSLHNTRDWDLHNNRQDFQDVTRIENNAIKYLYRPFDSQYIYYHQNLIEFPRNTLMRHLKAPNIALAIGRQGQVVGATHLWNLAFVSDCLLDVNLFRRGGATVFPLYLYQDQQPSTLFSNLDPEKNVNFSSDFIEHMRVLFKDKMNPEHILYYIYAILYSNTYRQLYREYLLNDYPHIPFTADFEIFERMTDLGKLLIDVHLLKSSQLNQPVVKYQGQSANHSISRPTYLEDEKLLYINADHYFEGLTPDVWNYHIGGYQVLDKYLKDRKGRKMDDPRHFIRVATALAKTIEIQEEIDVIYPEVEKNVIDFNLSD
jgi:predicted helicase